MSGRLALVCGGRDYDNYRGLVAVLDRLSPAVVVHGGARGADSLAGRWCDETGALCVVVPALWKAHGRSAGPRRNESMLLAAVTLAEHMYPDKMRLGVVAFHGGRGTADMCARAEKAGLPIWRPEEER